MILTTGTVVGLENGEERQSFKDFGQKATYRIMVSIVILNPLLMRLIDSLLVARIPLLLVSTACQENCWPCDSFYHRGAHFQSHAQFYRGKFDPGHFRALLKFAPQNNVRYDTTDQTWKVGPGHIELQDIVLFGVDIVSPGSMQPIYGVRRRR